MRFIVLGLIALLLAAPAGGATTTSSQSGAWSNTSTWDTGAVPASGDYVVIASGTSVTMSGTVTADSMSVVGSLATAGDAQFEIGYAVVTGDLTVTAGDSLLQAAAPLTSHTTPPNDGNTRNIWLQIRSGGTLNVYGNLAAETAISSTVATNFLVAGGVGSTVNIQGDNLGGDTISGIGNSAAPKQRVTVGNCPETATHLQLNNGWHKGAIYEIDTRVSATEVLLKRGKKDTFQDIHTAGIDSGLFLAPSDEIEEYVGSVALWGESSDGWSLGGRQLVNVIDGVAGNYSTWYQEAPTAAMVAADSVYVSEALFPNASITWFRAATVAGAVDGPADWPTRDSEHLGASFQEPDYTYGSVMMYEGDLDIDWAHLHNGGDSALANPLYVTTRGTVDVDNTYISDSSAGYMFALYEGGTDAGKSHEFTYVYVSDNVKLFDNASDGHFFMLFDADVEDDVTWKFSGARRLTDDFVYIRSGSAMTVEDSWMTEADGLCAFADGQANAAGATTMTLRRNWAIGAGDLVVQFNGANSTTAERDYVLEDNYWSRPNLKWNRYNATEGLTDLGPGTALTDVTTAIVRASAIVAAKSFTSTRDTLDWFNGAGYDLGVGGTYTNQADSVFVRRGVFRNGGFGGVGARSKGVSASSTAAGSGVTNGATTGYGATIVESCVFENNGKRGTLNDYGAYSSYGIGWKGGAGSNLHIRRCTFKGTHNTLSKDFYVYWNPNGAVSNMYISNSSFFGDATQEGAVVTVSSTGSVVMWRNQFVGFDRFTINWSHTGDEIFKFNTVHCPASGKRMFEGLQGPTIIGNVFLQRSGANVPFRFTAGADTTGSTIDWNVYRLSSSQISTLGGTAAGWLNNYDGNGSVKVSDGPSVREIVWRELLARPIAHNDTTSVAIDFVTDSSVTNAGDTTDEDGTALDAGAMPRLTDR